MITIIHGGDIVSSRKHFLSQREKSQSPLVLDGEKISLTDLVQTFEGSLFGSQRAIFIEGFLERKGKEFLEIASYLKSQQSSDIVLWEGKELSKPTLSIFPKANVTLFVLPKTLFSFLETIRPGNGKNLVSSFQKVLKQTEPELVFYMIVRQFRLLLALSDTVSKPRIIDEATRLAPWQKERLKRQALLFTQDKLKKIYDYLYKIDVSQKTGRTSLSLAQNIDIFLLDL